MITRARPGRTLLPALCALCWPAFPAYASDESRANLLFVEAPETAKAIEDVHLRVNMFTIIANALAKSD